MKYIKTYEGVMWSSSDPEYHMKKDDFKFRYGDHVRYSQFFRSFAVYKNDIFYITGIKDTPTNSYYLSYDNGKHLGWIKEDELELVPEYEIDAKKYNL